MANEPSGVVCNIYLSMKLPYAMRSSFLLRLARGQSMDNASSLRGWLTVSPKGKREAGEGNHSPGQVPSGETSGHGQWTGKCQVDRMEPFILHFNTKGTFYSNLPTTEIVLPEFRQTSHHSSCDYQTKIWRH